MLVQAEAAQAGCVRQVLNANYVVDTHERASARRRGWVGYDPQAPPYTLEEVRAQRRRYALPAAFGQY
jgi:hypothetical protein